MDVPEKDRYANERNAAGIRTAAIVIILGAVAVMADHAFFVAPRGSAPTSDNAPVAAAPARLSSDGFTLPDNLRPNAGDVQPLPASF